MKSPTQMADNMPNNYAFFARNVGQLEGIGADEENVHLFTLDDITSVNT